MASILKVDELQGIATAGDITVTSEGGAATQSLQQGLAKCWVNFNGAGTIASRDSFNVASLTDNGTGNYDINISNSMGNVNYSIQFCSSAAVNNDAFNRLALSSNLTSKWRVLHYESGGATLTDTDLLTSDVKGDLA